MRADASMSSAFMRVCVYIRWWYLAKLVTVLYLSYALLHFCFTLFPADERVTLSDWSSYTKCTVTCGGGIKARSRECVSKSSTAAKKCNELGPHFEAMVCNPQPCLVGGGFGPWSKFGECSVSCGIGFKRRTRRCVHPYPRHSRGNCTLQGPYEQVIQCRNILCVSRDDHNQWSAWGACSVSCDVGERQRVRTCQMSRDGRGCSASLQPLVERQKCKLKPCSTQVPS